MDKQKELFNKLLSTNKINDIQQYINEVINIRGFGNQSVEQELLLLTEEVGELAKAIRKEKTNMSIDKSKINNYDSIENEVADVFIVLVTICNTLEINLYNSIVEKEKINVNRVWDNKK